MATKIVFVLLVLSVVLEFSGLCQGQRYSCIFTACRKREVCSIHIFNYNSLFQLFQAFGNLSKLSVDLTCPFKNGFALIYSSFDANTFLRGCLFWIHLL